jgi:hypothetical protein
MENIICKDVATLDMHRFMEAMDLVIPDEPNEQMEKMVTALMKGTLIINEEGEAVYTPVNERSKHKDPIRFRERTGADLMAMGKKQKNDNQVAQLYAGMGSNTGLPPATFSSLVGADIKTCEAIFALLME